MKEKKNLPDNLNNPNTKDIIQTGTQKHIDIAWGKGLPVTVVQNNQIIKLFSDGSRQILGAAPKWNDTTQNTIQLGC